MNRNHYAPYTNGSEAWYADKEAVKAKDIIDDLVSSIDEQEGEIEELKQERDDLQVDYDELAEKNKELEAKVDGMKYDVTVLEIATWCDKLKEVGESMARFGEASGKELRRMYEIPDPDSSGGADGDGGAEGAPNETPG